MKKPHPFLLPVLICVLAAFSAGFFLGRNTFRRDVQISLPETTAPSLAVSTGDTGLININTAGIYELASLPGIGETIAVRIVEHRTEHGAFTAPEELLNVHGIGTVKLEEILDLITTGG